MRNILVIAALTIGMIATAQSNPINKNYSELNSLKAVKGEVYNVKPKVTLSKIIRTGMHGKGLRVVKHDYNFTKGLRNDYLLLETGEVLFFISGVLIVGVK